MTIVAQCPNTIANNDVKRARMAKGPRSNGRLSNGWTLSELNPFAKKDEEEEAAAEAPAPLVKQDVPAGPLVAVELLLLTALSSYGLKYLEPALGLPYNPSALAGWAICLGVPALVAYRFVGARRICVRLVKTRHHILSCIQSYCKKCGLVAKVDQKSPNL